jgi:lysozyme
MKMSDKGLEFLQDIEGCSYTAYKDTGGVLTIGVGHTGPEVVEGLRIDDLQVLAWLKDDTQEAEDAINEIVKVPLTQNQFDALVSFVFNVGVDAFKKSTMLRLLNGGDYTGAMNQFKRWNMDNGRVIAGLTKRRTLEASLFES